MTMYFLYIDPGTGSMLFSLFIGIATTLVFVLRALTVKLRFIISGGKTDKVNASKIPYVIYSDHKRYWNVFKPVCDEFEKRKINLVYYTQSPDDPALSEKYDFVKAEFIGEGNKGLVKMNMLNAGTVLSTTPQLGVLQWKRSRNVDRYVHVPHSFDIESYRMFALDHYDSVLTYGNNQIDFIKKIEELRPGINKKEILNAGATYFDEAVKYIKKLEVHNINKEKPTVLVAPSWGPSSILSRFGEQMITSLIDTGFTIIIRPHPQSFTAEKEILDPLMKKFTSVEWNRDNDNLSVLNRADMLITDFSSIMFDWAFMFERPFMYAETDFDSSIYDAAWIKEIPWVLNTAEKIGIKLKQQDFPKLKEIILDAVSNTSLAESRKAEKAKCWCNQGKAAQTIVDYMTGQAL